MTPECTWIESRLEDLFSDDPTTRGGIAAHLKECAACRREMEGHDQVDRLVVDYFSDRVARAERGEKETFRRGSVAAALAGFAAVLLVVWWGLGIEGNQAQSVASDAEPVFMAERVLPETPEGPDTLRGKPAPASGLEGSILTPTLSAEPPSSERRFYAMDAAGYFHSLSDFSGSVLLLAVLDESDAGTEAFERLYSLYGSRPELRLLAVALSPGSRPTTTKFPILINGGSSLLETGAGEFAIVTGEGAVHRRGSLEGEALETVIASSLRELGIP